MKNLTDMEVLALFTILMGTCTEDVQWELRDLKKDAEQGYGLKTLAKWETLDGVEFEGQKLYDKLMNELTRRKLLKFK